MSAPTRTVLLVDDEASILHLVRLVLEDEGDQVVTASDGREGWELLSAAEVTPDLVVTDLMMPHLDGWELCRRMQADGRLDKVPIIVMSAVARPSAEECRLVAALNKPFDVDALVREVERALPDG